MSLSDDAQLERIAEAQLIERMELSPEIRFTVSIILDNLRWFKIFCENESMSFSDVTPELVIQKVTGQVVTKEQLLKVRQEIDDRFKNGSLIETLPLTRRSRGTPRKRVAP